MINQLPDEIIEHILAYNHLEFVDVIRVGLTCKHLYKIIANSNKLWRHKFFQRWPNLKEAYKEFGQPQSQTINWKEEVQASICGRRKLFHQISLLSSENYRTQELSDYNLKEFDELFRPEEGAHPMAYYILVDELMNLLEIPEITSNLTHRYYALKVLRYMKQSYIKDEWQRFINLPWKQQTFERGATIVAQWSQPEKQISYSHIAEILDSIAEQTKEVLREEYPSHSIFSTPKEQFLIWKDNIIDDNQWSVTETRQAIDAMCKVLFDILGFCAISEVYDFPEHTFIDHVLEYHSGIPITLSIIFESVARRLGIHCEPVSFPTHFLLRWRERYTTPNANDTENYYIDIFDHGHFLTIKNCPRVSGVSKCPFQGYNIYEAASAVEVVKTMVAILEVANRQHTHLNGRSARLRSTFQLQYLVDPCSINAVIQLARFYMLREMDLTDIVKMLADIQKQNVDFSSNAEVFILSEAVQLFNRSKYRDDMKPKQRTPDIKYAVGLIMWHLKDFYLCVITDWDPCYKSSAKRKNGITLDEVENENQPFYTVYVDGGSCRYVPQEDIILAPDPQWISHCGIGRHFCKFNGMRYIPNEPKAREYPQDEADVNRILYCAYKLNPATRITKYPLH